MLLSRDNAIKFVSVLLDSVRSRGVSTHGWIIDHICYRTETTQEYESCKLQLTSDPGHDFAGVLLSEAVVNGRPIATIRMTQPLMVESFLVEAIEIPSPKSGVSYPSGFEHIEVVTVNTFDELKHIFKDFDVEDATQKTLNPELLVTLPTGRIKFHHLPLSALIEIENDGKLQHWLSKSKFLERLKPWQPLISGSIPIGVQLEKSDLDILLYSESPESATIEIKKALSDLGDLSWEKDTKSQQVFFARLDSGPRVVELFLSNQPVLNQNGHRHLLSEYLYLVKMGDALRQRVKALKVKGDSTEVAFAQALSLDGDPYQILLYKP